MSVFLPSNSGNPTNTTTSTSNYTVKLEPNRLGILIGVPVSTTLVILLGLFIVSWRQRRTQKDGLPEGLPVEERDESIQVIADQDNGTSKELVSNQSDSEDRIPPLPEPCLEDTVSSPPERAASLRLPDTHSYDPAAHAPEVCVAPPSLSPLPQPNEDIDQEIRVIEEEEERIRIRREMHQEVLRLQLEEESLRTRKAELMARRSQ